MTDWPFVWRARCINVVDGDTCDVSIDAGFHTVHTERLRLLGVNCPEVHGATKVAGDAATAFTRATLQMWQDPGVEWPLVVQTHRTDSFGRYLADVWPTTDLTDSLSDRLLAGGFAVPYK